MGRLVIFYGIVLTVIYGTNATTAAGECKIDRKAVRPSVLQPTRNPVSCFAVKCDHLNTVPKVYPKPPPDESLCYLDLSWNNITVLENNSFVNAEHLNASTVLFLYLDNSNIYTLLSNAFAGLSRLLYLNLSGNQLAWPEGFGKGVFKPLSSLKFLNMKTNEIYSFNGLGLEMRYLKDLQDLYIELCVNCSFDKSFEELTSLVNLSLSGRHSSSKCQVPVVQSSTFVGLTKLQRLWLSSCNINEIEANAFLPLNKTLTLLDISYNEKLGFTGMNTALQGLRFSTRLKVLSVNRIHNVHGIGVALKVNDTENLSTLQALIKLHMDLNKIEIFDKSIFDPVSRLPTSLRDFTLSGNRLSLGEYVHVLHNALNITCLDISRQNYYRDPFFRLHTNDEDDKIYSSADDNLCMENLTIIDFTDWYVESKCLFRIPPNLRRLRWRKSFMSFDLERNATICGATQLSHLDLSFNLFTKWMSDIKGLENVTNLDLSENYCHEIHPDFFDNFVHLKYLNVSGNYLGETFHKSPSSKPANQVLRSLKEIVSLDLSSNKIKGFSDRLAFRGMNNLQLLYVHSNFLNHWNYEMPNGNSLKLIDLSRNKLRTLDTGFREYLDERCQGMYCNVSLVLKSNPLECSCEYVPFLEWMLVTKIHIRRDHCRFKYHDHKISSHEALKEMIKKLKEDCRDKTWVTWTVGSVGAVSGCVTSIVIGVLVYRNRWKLRYLYYSRNRRFNHVGFERLFEHDSYVSYSKCKASFIKNCMVPSLEEQRGLRLWVADRNSIPGTSVAENIVHGIYNSRKAVLLIDKDYLKDSWCDYEMNMVNVEAAETRRKLIIIVLMEHIPMDTLPISVLRFLRSERSLEYPELEQDMGTFWTNLADEIMC